MTTSMGELMTRLRFSQADLRANQSGFLSPTQSTRLSGDLRRILWITSGFFVVLVLIATALIYAGATTRSQIAVVAGFALVLINGLLLGVAGREYMRLSSDLRSGAVEALAGKVERILKRGRAGDRFLLRIGGEDISVDRDLVHCFQHHARYCIYRTQRSKVLLSALPLGEHSNFTDDGN